LFSGELSSRVNLIDDSFVGKFFVESKFHPEEKLNEEIPREEIFITGFSLPGT